MDRRFLYRAHIWLGWIVGVQLFLWTLSGLVMTLWPIESVRGEHLRRPPAEPALAEAGSLVAPESLLARAGQGGDSLTLRMLASRPVWELRGAGRPTRLFDARTGVPLRLDREAIRALAAARYAGEGSIAAIMPVDPGAPPLEFRREQAAWQVTFADRAGTRFYIDAANGDLLAVRTDRWRLFDLMWGLHIMDWRAREDTHHPVLVAAAALSLASVAGGLALLALRRLPRRTRAGGEPRL